MKMPNELDRAELMAIVAKLQKLFYLTVQYDEETGEYTDEEVYDPDKNPHDGPDMIDTLRETLTNYGLTPASIISATPAVPPSPAVRVAPSDVYGQEDEIEAEISESVGEHHVQNVIGYLARLYESAKLDNVSSDPAVFHEATTHLRRAQAALATAGFHDFDKLYKTHEEPYKDKELPAGLELL